MPLFAQKSVDGSIENPESPRSLNECPNYQNAVERHRELQMDVLGIKDEIREFDAAISDHALESSVGSEAAQFVSGKLEGQAILIDLKSKRHELGHRLSVLEEAVSLQAKIVDQELYKASELITATYLPDYRHIIDKQAQALESLKEVAIEEEEFIDQLKSLGIRWTSNIRRMNFLAIGDIHLETSNKSASVERIDHWLDEAVQYEFI